MPKTTQQGVSDFFNHASLIAEAGGLAHDFGKIPENFQRKLLDDKIIADPIRHEWISLWILEELFKEDKWRRDDFLGAWERLSGYIRYNNVEGIKKSSWLGNLSVHDVVKFSVLTHHKMFGPRKRDMGNVKKMNPKSANLSSFFNDTNNISSDQLAIENAKIDREYENILSRLEDIHKNLSKIRIDKNGLNGLALIARAALVLADHEVSSRESDLKDSNELIANSYAAKTRKESTKKVKGRIRPIIKEETRRFPKQTLSCHLKEVSKRASEITGYFDSDNNRLSSLDYRDYKHLLIPGDPNSRFAWQDKAVNFLRGYQNKQVLVFNVASTGAGKTLTSFKALLALKEEEPVRISSVLNLRSLTLQTHNSYKKDLQLSDSECACVIGDMTVRKLHELNEAQDEEIDYNEVEVEANTTGLTANMPEWLEELGNQKKGSVKEIIGAPVLVSTIDYLIAAGEPYKQAHHAIALLRASTSDIIIDEIDSYDTRSFISVLRLITVHAMMGRNVVVSSATLMPESAEAIATAFKVGVNIRKSVYKHTQRALIAISDLVEPRELYSNTDLEPNDRALHNSYSNYCIDIAEKGGSSSTKIFKVARLEQDIESLYKTLPAHILELHDNNKFAPKNSSSYDNISVGLIRVANVKPCMSVAKKIQKYFSHNDDYDVRVCTYHAKEVLSRRFYKEYHLDRILTRKDRQNPNRGIEDFINHEGFKPRKSKNLILIVVATPVEEVGRDHDFDWAIIEPSSIHSILQTAGRVNRHRLIEIMKANIILLQYNIRFLENKIRHGVFIRPGFEIKDNEASSHNHLYDLAKLLSIKDCDKERPLNYKYIFGSSSSPRCRFADYDALSIKTQIDRVRGILTLNDPLWASRWFSEAFPLRARQNDKSCYFADNKEKLDLWQISRENSRPVKIKENLESKKEEGPLRDVCDLENTFLSPSIQESLSFIRNIDPAIETEDVATFSLYENEEIDIINWQGIKTYYVR